MSFQLENLESLRDRRCTIARDVPRPNPHRFGPYYHREVKNAIIKFVGISQCEIVLLIQFELERLEDQASPFGMAHLMGTSLKEMHLITRTPIGGAIHTDLRERIDLHLI